MEPILKILLEILGGGLTFALLYKIRTSGCLIKKKPNSFNCQIKMDIDGDGKDDLKISVTDSPTSTTEEIASDVHARSALRTSDVHAPSGAHRSSESKI